MICLQVFFYWLFAKTINYYSSLNVLGITGGNIFFDKDGTFQWSSIAALVSFVAACLTFIGVFINVSTQKKIAKQQIDANLKAKARIKWIQEVREISARLITNFSELKKDQTNFKEKYINISRDAELLKLYFGFYGPKEKTTLDYDILFNTESNDNKNQYIFDFIDSMLDDLNNESFDKYNLYLKKYEEYKEKLAEYNKAIEKYCDVQIDKYGNPEIVPKKEHESQYDYYFGWIQEFRSKNSSYYSYIREYDEKGKNFEQIISIYLKIEWDKAKEGQ